MELHPRQLLAVALFLLIYILLMIFPVAFIPVTVLALYYALLFPVNSILLFSCLIWYLGVEKKTQKCDFGSRNLVLLFGIILDF